MTDGDPTPVQTSGAIKALDHSSVHRITSGQVVVDLQTAVKELVENSLDAGATTIDVRFKDQGLTSIEVLDNGSGIDEQDWEGVALKHHTSKLGAFSDLTTISSFGFRGEAISSLCALSEGVSVTTATRDKAPMGAVLKFDRAGRMVDCKSHVARQRGTTTVVTALFKPLPVRRKELERNIKREFGKALSLLTAYALVPCSNPDRPVRLSVSNQPGNGKKTVHLQTSGAPSPRAAVSALWGPKTSEGLVDLDLALSFRLPQPKWLKKKDAEDEDEEDSVHVRVAGLVSRFAVGGGRAGPDRQWFFVNGRPWNAGKVQKAFNEAYRTFNATQAPFVVADFRLPTANADVNVSPDKRTIFLHGEAELVEALRAALEEAFAPGRATFDVGVAQSSVASTAPTTTRTGNGAPASESPASTPVQAEEEEDPAPSSSRGHIGPDARSEFGAPTLLLEPETPSAPSTELEVDTEAVERDDVQADDEEQGEQEPRSFVHQIPASAVRPSWKSRALSSPSAPLGNGTAFANTSKSAASKGKGVQMLLSTEGAAWSLKDAAKRTEVEERAVKKPRLDPSQRLRRQLSAFAREGSQLDAGAGGEDELVDDDLNDRADAQADGGESEGADEGADAQDDGVEAEGAEMQLAEPEDVDEDAQAAAGVVDAAETEMDVDPEDEPDTQLDIESSSAVGSASSVLAPHPSYSSTPEVIRPDMDEEDVVLQLDLERLEKAWRASAAAAPGTNAPDPRDEELGDAKAAAGLASEGAVEEALARVIAKADFGAMEVVGQFNLGFIVVRLRKGRPQDGEDIKEVSDDLFIVDQHAADEKYNFETLQRTTRMQSQRLFRPMPLELTAADRLVAEENVEVLKANGFEIVFDEQKDNVGEDEDGRSDGQDEEADMGQGRIRLVAQPVSKNTVFDMRDLEELLHLMQDRPSGTMVRCSKARAMFASRACRKSVMIGRALTKGQMTSILRHMGTMDQPWNCPHGRPTMRHLMDLGTVQGAAGERSPSEVDWARFGASSG